MHSNTLVVFALGVTSGVIVAATSSYFLSKRKKVSITVVPRPCSTVAECIGNTPCVKLRPERMGVDDCLATIYAKLEFQNPGGSVKDRIAVSMIDKAEREGLITPGKTTLVEATSGNTGIAIAMVGAARGYKVIVAMPRLQSMLERYILIRSFGGNVLLSEPDLKSQGFLDLAETYAKEHSDCYLMRQFTNSANPDAHYRTTAPELWEQMDGRVDAVVMGAGTGGTAVGVGQYLKEKNAQCQVIVVEPSESRVFQNAVHRTHSIVGIGTGLHVPMLEKLDPGAPFIAGQGRGLVDEFVSTDTPDSLDIALLLAETHGLLVGPSTGAAVHAAMQLGRRDTMKGKTIVVIAPSSGVRYLQHPMFRTLRRQAFEALSEEVLSTAPLSMSNANSYPSAESVLHDRALEERKAATQAESRLELVGRVQGCVLGLVRTLLEAPDLKPSDNLIDHGATSLTAMLLLGKLRSSLEGVLEGAEIRGLRLAIIKERLWGCTRDLALGVVGVDEHGNENPTDAFLNATVTIEYCGG